MAVGCNPAASRCTWPQAPHSLPRGLHPPGVLPLVLPQPRCCCPVLPVRDFWPSLHAADEATIPCFLPQKGKCHRAGKPSEKGTLSVLGLLPAPFCPHATWSSAKVGPRRDGRTGLLGPWFALASPKPSGARSFGAVEAHIWLWPPQTFP